MKCPHRMKSKIAPAVRAKLEGLGADVVRSKLTWIMNVRTLSQQDEPEPLGDNLSATRKEMQEWLKEKAASDRWWVIVAAIAAVAAAMISLFAWIFPRG